jgi:putative transposase
MSPHEETSLSQTYQSLAHSRWDGKDHVVFVPKRRRQQLFGHMRQALGPLFHELARQKACWIIEGHLMPDHVHRCIEIPPKHAVASVIGYLKGKSAIAMARQFAGKDRHFAGEHFWARGDAVSTVGFELDPVRAYIREQEEADGQGRFETLHKNRPPLRRSRSSSQRLCRGCLTCAGHDTLTANRKEGHLKPAVIGRKGNAKKWQGHVQKWRG